MSGLPDSAPVPATASIGTREPLARVEAGLPAAWYLDEAHHRRELERVWNGSWIAAARCDEVGMPGDFRVVDIGEQSVLLTRHDDGGLRAFHNICRHRGSILCTEAQGRLRGGRIVCPYHAWTYDLDGRLQSTPRRMPTGDFDPADFGLFPVAVDTWGGFVFVHLGSGPVQPLSEALGWIPSTFASHRLDALVSGHRRVVDVQANWKLVCENFCECFHCPPVHPELCRVVPAYREGGAWGLRRDEQGRPIPEASAEYRAGARTLTLDGTARVPPFAGLDEAQRSTLYMPALLPPNLFLNVHPDYVNSHLMFPTGPGSVRIVYDWLFEPQALADPAFDLEHYVALWRVTNGQDARNCEWQQRGIRARVFQHGVFMPQEFDCHRFAGWVRDTLASATTGQRPI
ncbi:MAG: aromatic ring-hydroxylating dioxygenase subunit alpha [Burkholderiales bacterium]|nr:aromatic ring-hydroxylating dioxygenase subunit alpha [Burkholderiales bacterium]